MSTRDADLAKLRRAALDEPRNGERRYLLGAELAEQRDYEGAVLELSAAIALSPLLHVARLQLGLLHLTLAQPDHALHVLAPLEDLPDESPLKHFKRGLEALIRDDFAACVSALEHGIALNQDNAPLNADMRLIVSQVQCTVETNRESQDPSAVRTDFSLYGMRH
jgi:tetratricopeptide (TPR) repeat protein